MLDKETIQCLRAEAVNYRDLAQVEYNKHQYSTQGRNLDTWKFIVGWLSAKLGESG